MKAIELNDVTLSVLDEGQGPCLMFLHGFPLDHQMWSHQVAYFSETHRVLVPDLRGFGRSSYTSEETSMETLADDVAALIAKCNSHNPISVCGLSMGGYIAWQLWKRHPHVIKNLILCDTRAAGDTPEVARGRRLMAEKVLTAGSAEVTAPMVSKLFCQRTLDHQAKTVAQQQEIMAKTSPHTIAAIQRGMANRADFTNSLHQVGCPSLLLCGAEDGITPAKEMKEISEQMPAAEFKEIANAGHMAPLEQPDATNVAIADFLRRN